MEEKEEIESNNFDDEGVFEEDTNSDDDEIINAVDKNSKNNSGKTLEVDLKEILEDTIISTKKNKIISGSTIGEIDDEFTNKEEKAQELVEASLFIAGKFLNMQELIMLTDLNQIMIKDILAKLMKRYDKGIIRIVERNNSYKMDVAQEYHFLINKLAGGTTEFTKAEQETLAVIAYKQPVKQSVIIKIRGNKSYDHVKKFTDLGLVISKPVGHTTELTLSEEFYEYFNVHKK
jgi:segregation and condensation protein B